MSYKMTERPARIFNEEITHTLKTWDIIKSLDHGNKIGNSMRKSFKAFNSNILSFRSIQAIKCVMIKKICNYRVSQ